MKTIKPQKLGILTRVFENGKDCQFVVTVIAFFPFSSPSHLLPEVALWKFAAQALAKEGALDICMPKSRGELLVTGSAYTLGAIPQIACSVRVKIATIDKTLRVVGDRFWKRSGVVSSPEPFTQLPISYEAAFGGEGYDQNPLGKGFARLQTDAGEAHALPNVEDPARLIRSPKDRPPPAGFGPYDFTWPQRFSKMGTYDENWLKERFPGFAKDIDWTIFNAAPEDQQINGYFRGNETFSIENMHPSQPLLEGKLPGVAARVFINQKTDSGDVFREIPTRLDTVRLFPDIERGILIFRGLATVADDDGSDILQLVAACENIDSPKPAEHYQTVLAQRLDKEKGHLFALRDSDLMPASVPEAAPFPDGKSDMDGLSSEGLLRKNLRRREEQEREKARERVRALGLNPDQCGLPPLLPEEPAADAENLEVLVQSTTEKSARQKELSDAARAEAEQRARQLCSQHGLNYAKVMQPQGGPPKFSADEEIEGLQRIVQSAKEAGAQVPQIEQMLANPDMIQILKSAEAKLREMYQQFAHHLAPAAPLGTGESEQARARVILACNEKKKCFSGWDLTGSDLSDLDLAGADFKGALLEAAKLRGCKLLGADFSNAVLARADLCDADLSNARLSGANLGSAKLCGARLSGVDLTGAVLSKADLENAHLDGAIMLKADLSEANVSGVDFSGIQAPEIVFLKNNLTGAKFVGATLTKCTFLEVKADQADFSWAKLAGAVFVSAVGPGADFRAADLENLRLVKECSFPNSQFQEARLNGANLRGSDLAGSDFTNAQLNEADLSECKLGRCIFYRASAVNSRFVKADLSEAVMRSVNLMQSLLQKARIEASDFRQTNLFRADLAKVRGRVLSLDGANLTQVRIMQRNGNG